MHCLRLLFECIELMREGRITLPRPERELLIEVRSGAWTLERFLREAEALEKEARLAAEISDLPDAVDKQVVSELISDCSSFLLDWSRVLTRTRLAGGFADDCGCEASLGFFLPMVVRMTHLLCETSEFTGLVGGAEFDRDEVVDAAGGAFVFGDDELEGAFFVADGFAVDGVGDDDVSGMEGGVGFGE